MSNIYFQISPVLHVFRIFCLLPFSSLNLNSADFIQVNLISRFIIIFLQLLVLYGYLLHACVTLQQITINPNSASVQEASTFASLLILHFVDIVNLVNIIFLSQKLCRVLQEVLQKLELVDKILNIFTYNSRQHYIIYSILFVLMYCTKTMRLIYALDKMHLTLRICPRIASGIFFAAEFLVLILCLELRYRLQIMNMYLAKKRVTKIKSILKAFEILRYSHDILNKNFGSFLLFNLSQLFMLILFGLLGLLIPCIAGLGSPFGGPTDFSRCSSFAVLLLDGITRFSLLIWACSSVYQEEERTAWLSSRILHRGIKEKTNHKLQSLLELALVRRLKFSACRFFDIDLPLLFAAAGAIMSYMFLITQLK